LLETWKMVNLNMREGKKVKIIVDANALCHRARHAMDTTKLSYHEMSTEVIFNFIMALPMLSKALDSGNFLFVWDSGRYFRKDVYPEYKVRPKEEKTIDEKKIDDISYEQFKILRKKVIPDMGFSNTFIQTGMEADDIIAAITLNYLEDDFVIVSRDNDLYQLLTDQVSMYDPILKKKITKHTFIDKYGIDPSRWWEAKAIAGCSTDTVEGIEGVGEPTAIKYLNDELPSHHKTYKRIRDNPDIVDRNTSLVKLPYEGTIVPDIVEDDLIIGKFLGVFEEYNFQSQLTDDSFARWMSLIERYESCPD